MALLPPLMPYVRVILLLRLPSQLPAELFALTKACVLAAGIGLLLFSLTITMHFVLYMTLVLCINIMGSLHPLVNPLLVKHSLQTPWMPIFYLSKSLFENVLHVPKIMLL